MTDDGIVTDHVIEHGWIDLDGVANMRDLGGLPTADGRRIRRHRLIRSDNLQDLSPEDITHLTDRVGLTDVVDLRSHAEVQAEGDGPLRALRAVGHHHHSLYPDDLDVTGAEALLLPWQQEVEEHSSSASEEKDETFWTEHYLRYLSRRPDSILAALDVLRVARGATLVHCAAGKDRTGTVVGIALTVAGVPDELVVADYAASAQRIDRIIERLAATQTYGSHLQHQSVADQTPRAETMVAMLHALRDRFGGGEGWLLASGWDTSRVSELRAALVEDVPAQVDAADVLV